MAQKADKDDPPPRRGRADSVAPDIGRVAMSAFARAGFTDPTLVLRWDEIAGPEVARLARPLRFSEGPSGGVLTLKAEPGAALFLGHETRALCERINAYLGRPAVAKLKFSQGALAARAASPPARPTKPRAVAPGDPAARYAGPDGLGRALLNLARLRSHREQP
jgi:hypothetical protein